MLNHFLYCRKSSEDEERQIVSNESQEDELSPLAKRDGLRVAEIIKEEASAKAAGTRPRFNDMTMRIRKGEANAILCWHLNRLSRNAGDAAALIELMDQGKLLEIRTPSQTLRNTPGDKFLIFLFCGQAKLENDNKGQDVQRGLRKKLAMGWQPGQAPMGYLNDKTKLRGERDIYNDPERFSLVRKMWQYMLTGTYSPSQILNIANNEWGFRTRKTRKQGGNPLSKNALYHIFHSPFYYGSFEYPIGSGKWHQGKHEPMVTKAEFERVQAILARKGNPRASRHLTFPFTGLVRCGACSGMITAEEKRQVICSSCRSKFTYRNRERCPKCQIRLDQMTKPLFLEYVYYHCAKRNRGCRQPSIEIKAFEKQISEKLVRLHVPDKLRQWAFTYLQEIYEADVKNGEFTSQSRAKAYAECLKRIEALVVLKTSPANSDGSLLSEEEYVQERQKLLKDKTRLDPSVDHVKKQRNHALKQAKLTFDFANVAPGKFKTGDHRIKKAMLATLGSNLRLLDKKLIIKAGKALEAIEQYLSSVNPDNTLIEPKNHQAIARQNQRNKPHFSLLLWDVDDVRTWNRKSVKLVSKIYRHFRSAPHDFGPHIWN